MSFAASPLTDGGLDLGTSGTSVLFLGVDVSIVSYLTLRKIDRTESTDARHRPSTPR